MNKNLELIRQKCIEANPEIMELKEGCKIEGGYMLQDYCASPYVVVGGIWICKKHKKYRQECQAEEDGCSGEEGFEIKYGDEEEGEGWGTIRVKKSELGEVLGRPIRLADVLLAMNKLQHDGSYVISDAGIFAHFKAEGARIGKALRVLECSWNLRKDDVNEQSEETIDFLARLLC